MRVNGIDLLPFSPQQRAIIAALALQAPRIVPMGELIEAIYPDPDKEPDTASKGIAQQAIHIRRKWTNRDWRFASRLGPNGGYYLERTHACD